MLILFTFILFSLTGPEKPLRYEGALGMENYEIFDDQIRASSQHAHNTPPKVARLNRKDGTDKLQGAWVPSTHDVNQWLQIDLMSNHISVSRVATQGRDGNECWVTKFKLDYSNDGVNFRYHKEQGQATDKVNGLIPPRWRTPIWNGLGSSSNEQPRPFHMEAPPHPWWPVYQNCHELVAGQVKAVLSEILRGFEKV